MTQHFRPTSWGFAVLACAVVLVLAVLPPFVGPGFRYALMQGFDLACHQIPDRSFQIGGIPFALCHRCLGVVVGLVIGTLALVVFRKADGSISRHLRIMLILSILPMLVDWGLDAFGLWANTPFSRVATGLVFGVVAGYTFARALAVSPPINASALPVFAAQSDLSHPQTTAHA